LKDFSVYEPPYAPKKHILIVGEQTLPQTKLKRSVNMPTANEQILSNMNKIVRKAVLEINVPECCLDCNFYFNSTHYRKCNAIVLVADGLMWAYEDKPYDESIERAPFCPLKIIEV
jgi:hypothetical protein